MKIKIARITILFLAGTLVFNQGLFAGYGYISEKDNLSAPLYLGTEPITYSLSKFLELAGKTPLDVICYLYDAKAIGPENAVSLEGAATQAQLAILERLGIIYKNERGWYVPEYLAERDIEDFSEDNPELKYSPALPATEEMAKDILEHDEGFNWHAMPKEIYKKIIEKDGYLNLLRIRNACVDSNGMRFGKAFYWFISEMYKFFGDEFFAWWPALVEEIIRGGDYRWIKCFKGTLINAPEDIEKYSEDIQLLLEAAEDHGALLFERGFPDAISVLGKDLPYYWPGLVAMGSTCGGRQVSWCFQTIKEAKELLGVRFKEDLPDLILMAVNNQGKLKHTIFSVCLYKLKQEFGEDFEECWPQIKELANKEKGSITALLRYGIPGLYAALKKKGKKDYWTLCIKLGLSANGRAGLLFSLLRGKDFQFQDEMESFGRMCIDIVSQMRPQESKFPSIIRGLESLAFEKPELFTREFIKKIDKAIPDTKRTKYAKFYAAMRAKKMPKFDKGLFPFHEKVQEILKKGEKNVLISHNLKEGLGDELILNGSFAQALFDYNPKIKMVMDTGNNFIFDRKDLSSFWPYSIESFDILFHQYDAEKCLDPMAEQRLQDYLQAHKPKIYIRCYRAHQHEEIELFIEGEKVEIPKSYNAYNIMFKILAELGIPFRVGEQKPRTESVFIGGASADADKWWRINVEKENTQKRPLIFMNMFGGESDIKGYTKKNYARLAREMEDIIDKGYFILFSPYNEALFGPDKEADQIVEMLPKEKQRYVRILPCVKKTKGLYKYIMHKSDLVVTVESGITHFAYGLGKPLLSIGYLEFDLGDEGSEPYEYWVPIAAGSNQIYTSSKYDFSKYIKDVSQGIEVLNAGYFHEPYLSECPLDEKYALEQRQGIVFPDLRRFEKLEYLPYKQDIERAI